MKNQTNIIALFIVFFAAYLFSGCATTKTNYLPFQGHTHMKPLQGRMTQQQVSHVQLGGKFYTRCNGIKYHYNTKIRPYIFKNRP
jgi:hypothetical protein